MNNNAKKSVNEALNGSHLDAFDIEAMNEARAIGRAKGLTPRKVGQQRSGFGRPAYHPNRGDYGDGAPRRYLVAR